MALNAFSGEKSMISRSLQKIDDFKKDLRYYQEELTERKTQSELYLDELPQQMNGMFKDLEGLVDSQEKSFYGEIAQTVQKQQEAISRDNKNKVPGFEQRLAQKYTELQNATKIASEQGIDRTIDVLD